MDDALTRPIAIAQVITVATFTAEPLERPLNFWMAELNLPASVKFAPYDQVFQQLLDPNSELSRNQRGVNVVLVRLEDWRRGARNRQILMISSNISSETQPISLTRRSNSPRVRRRPCSSGSVLGCQTHTATPRCRRPQCGSSDGSTPSWR